MKILIYHKSYSCDTGCCGHVIEVDGKEEFYFVHPCGTDAKKFAEDLICQKFGKEHIDLDWEHCTIVDD